VELRCNAIHTLRYFRDFSPAKACEQIVGQDEDRLVHTVLNLISDAQFGGFENVLLLAARHSEASVRREAVEILGKAGATEAEKELVRMAQYDADAGVKSSALYALSCMRSAEGLALCRGLLRTDERGNKFEAWRCLQVWEDDADAVELIQKYKNDPDIGRLIAAHLDRFAK
jgi:HEAT repeat protein